jgi:hypothetical protein
MSANPAQVTNVPPKDPPVHWVGSWAGADDARVRIDATGHFKAELIINRTLFFERREVEGELPAARAGQLLAFTLDGEYTVFANAPNGPLDKPLPKNRYTFGLRFDPEADELLAEYRTSDLNKQYRLKRVKAGDSGSR